MHTHACTCQLAECRPWRLFCSMTCTGTEMTKIPFITISLCVSPSYFVAVRARPPPPCHCVGFHSVFFLHPNYQNGPFGILSAFTAAISISHSWLASFLIVLIFFLDVTALYSPFHSCTVPAPPPPLTMSYVTLEQNTNNKKVSLHTDTLRPMLLLQVNG